MINDQEKVRKTLGIVTRRNAGRHEILGHLMLELIFDHLVATLPTQSQVYKPFSVKTMILATPTLNGLRSGPEIKMRRCPEHHCTWN